jgi:hypothetical protein
MCLWLSPPIVLSLDSALLQKCCSVITITVITKELSWNFWFQMVILVHKSIRLQQITAVTNKIYRPLACLLLTSLTVQQSWASADFFPGGGAGGAGGAKTYYMPKNARKHTIFFHKSWKHTILAGQGGGGGKFPFLPSPADAHADSYYSSLCKVDLSCLNL